MLFQGINTWMCLAAVTSFVVIEFLSLGFHHSTPTACFHFFVNFVRPQPPVCLWPKIKFPFGNHFPSIWGKFSLEYSRSDESHHLNTNYAFLLRVGYKKTPIFLLLLYKGPCDIVQVFKHIKIIISLIIQGIFGGHHFTRACFSTLLMAVS